MITADQLVAHAIGDYLLQSDWMASKKRTDAVAAAVHAVTYSVPFLFVAGPHRTVWLWLVIIGSHFLIDHYGLARYVVWAKNFLAPRWLPEGWRHDLQVRNQSWEFCQATGYPPDRPPFLAVWLLIIADNILHVVINGLALRYL